MSDKLDNITTIYQEFKETFEKDEVIKLSEENKALKLEIEQLKILLINSIPHVERIIVSPEEALLDSQVLMIQERSYGQELSLEDVKKLDILLKQKKIFKDEAKIINAQAKKLPIPSIQLLDIIKKK